MASLGVAVGMLGLLFNSYMFLLMCGKSTIVEKFRVNLVGKVNAI